MLTREYPPEVYGGAGVHVDFLTRELARLVDVEVHCLGAPRPGAIAHAEDDARLVGANPVLRIFAADLEMAAAVGTCHLVHSHTWYANLAGHLAKLLHGIPHVVTSHSLEPSRPWKAEQLGGGYALSSWAERTAYEAADAVIAVSAASKLDVLAAYPDLDPARVHVVHNGIDTELYRPVAETDVLAGLGIDVDRPIVSFVGRVTRQKGVPHLLRAAAQFDPAAQVLLLAGAADTPDLAAETDAAVADADRDAQRCRARPRGAAPSRRAPGAQPLDGLRVPVDLRAARHRQPGGDGVRHGRRRQRRRRHPGGRGRR